MALPSSMLQKWFPDKRGLITGLAVGGFGFGAVLTSPIAQGLIDSNKDVPTKAFLPLGIGYLILSLIGASFFRNPPTGYQVPGFSPATSGPVVDSGKDYTEKEALRTPQWYLLMTILALNVTAGIALISQAAASATDIAGYTKAGAAGLVGPRLGVPGDVGGAGRCLGDEGDTGGDIEGEDCHEEVPLRGAQGLLLCVVLAAVDDGTARCGREARDLVATRRVAEERRADQRQDEVPDAQGQERLGRHVLVAVDEALRNRRRQDRTEAEPADRQSRDEPPLVGEPLLQHGARQGHPLRHL